MSEKSPQGNPSKDTYDWDFSDVSFMHSETNIDDDTEVISNIEIEEMLEAIDPFIKRVEPEMLKKVFDGWKKRQDHYRQLMREEESAAELNDADCATVADMFYLGTIFRDYLDSILGVKDQGRSYFQLYDSLDADVEKWGTATGVYDRYEDTVNMIGDRFDTKMDYLVTIGHEMWHVHQKQIVDNNGERAELYKSSFSDYVDPKDNYEKYVSQPIELEAEIFASKLREKLESAMKLSSVMHHNLTEKIVWSNSH